MAVPEKILLEVTGLKTWFPVRGHWFEKQFVRAVDGVTFAVPAGATLALVGESGSGKTTVGRTVLGLIPASGGTVRFDGVDTADPAAVRLVRRRMQMIFQDPFGSLNPRMTVGGIVGEPIKVHHLADSARQRREMVGRLLERVGLAANHAGRYPHEFSGGQRQRVGIARALASQPDFIVCDEPVSALDVSIQSQILNLLSDLQDELGLTYLFIAHNLAVVEHFSDTVAVMYLGKIVEVANRDDLYARPRHPYAEALFAAVPIPDPLRRAAHARLAGETPSPINPPSGCPFHPRCPLTRQTAEADPANAIPVTYGADAFRAARVCVEEVPALLPVPDAPTHCHACHLRR